MEDAYMDQYVDRIMVLSLLFSGAIILLGVAPTCRLFGWDNLFLATLLGGIGCTAAFLYLYSKMRGQYQSDDY